MCEQWCRSVSGEGRQLNSESHAWPRGSRPASQAFTPTLLSNGTFPQGPLLGWGARVSAGSAISEAPDLTQTFELGFRGKNARSAMARKHDSLFPLWVQHGFLHRVKKTSFNPQSEYSFPDSGKYLPQSNGSACIYSALQKESPRHALTRRFVAVQCHVVLSVNPPSPQSKLEWHGAGSMWAMNPLPVCSGTDGPCEYKPPCPHKGAPVRAPTAYQRWGLNPSDCSGTWPTTLYIEDTIRIPVGQSTPPCSLLHPGGSLSIAINTPLLPPPNSFPRYSSTPPVSPGRSNMGPGFAFCARCIGMRLNAAALLCFCFLLQADIEPGEYVLGWRWDCEETTQIWQSCSDITIV